MKPKLRFKEFNDDWTEYEQSDILSENNIPIEKPKEEYWRLGIRSHYKGTFYELADPEKNSMDKLFIVKPNNLIINITFAWEQAYAITTDEDNNKIVSHRFPMYSFKDGFSHKFYKYRIDNKKYKYELGLASPGGAGRNRVLNKSSFLKIKQYIPSIKEQNKISDFFELFDKRISLQLNKIEKLKQFKKGLSNNVFSKIKIVDEVKLGDICNITTGKLDANAMVENGPYRFYTCARDYYYIDKYAFDTEALLISGNGAYVGYIHYYKGKFNAYQRTYVLDNFSANIQYIKVFLDEFLHKRINFEKKEGNTPYIVLSTLSDMNIKLINQSDESLVINLFNSINKKIELEEKRLEELTKLKKGLIQKMFV